MTGSSTHHRRLIRAPRPSVYNALVDKDLIARWKVPDGMTSQVHEFDGREGGAFRISLTYEDSTREGKSEAHTDTYHGRFVKLVPNVLVIEEDEFETADPALQGTMRITIELRDAAGGTDLVATHEGLPTGVSPDDNEAGWDMALARLAALVETA